MSIEQFEDNKFYPIGTEVIVDGKECIVEKSEYDYGCRKCVFYDKEFNDCGNENYGCTGSDREDKISISLTLKSLL